MSEHDDQCVIFQWASLQESVYPELALLFSTLNGVRLPIGLAVKAKQAGNKKGVPDLILPCARGKYHGLYLELKYGKNQPTEQQQFWINRLKTEGYYVCVVWGFEEASEKITWYLELED
jgi:hypothetical protein